MTFREMLAKQLEIDEGRRSKLYKCSAGKLSIGVGRNLEDRGLRDSEIDLMLDNDIAEAIQTARKLFPGFERLSDVRKAVLCNIAFQLGETRLSAFRGVRAAVEAQAWSLAADEMLDSAWSKQTPKRAVRLAEQMRNG